MSPRNRARLRATALLLGTPEWRLLGLSFLGYLNSMLESNPKLAEELIQRLKDS